MQMGKWHHPSDSSCKETRYMSNVGDLMPLNLFLHRSLIFSKIKDGDHLPTVSGQRK